MTKPRRKIPGSIEQLIRSAFPNGIVDIVDFDESYFWKIHSRLRRQFSKIKDAKLLYEQFADGNQICEGVPIPEMDSLDEDGLPMETPFESSSFHLFFAGLSRKELTYVCEGPAPWLDQEGGGPECADENLPPECVNDGKGWIGWSVAVSLLAPLAVAKLRTFETYGLHECTVPTIEPQIFLIDGGPVDMEQYAREVFGLEVLAPIRNLQIALASILQKAGIELLTDEVAGIRVPRITASEDVLTGSPDRKNGLTIQDIFFYRCL